MQTALESLKELNALAWSSYVVGTDEFDKIPGSKSMRNVQGLAMYRGKIPCIEEGDEGADDVEAAPLLRQAVDERARLEARRAAAEDALEDRVEKTITAVYQACFRLEENMKLADAEWYVGSRGGHAIFVPDPPLCLARPTAMPLAELAEAGMAIRRTARQLTQLVNTLGYGFRSELREMLGDAFPDELMRSLGLNCQAVTGEMARAWAASPAIAPAPLVAFVSSVASLVATSDRQRRQIIHALKKHRASRPGRLGWDRLMDALAKEHAPGGAPTPSRLDNHGRAGAPPASRVLSAPANISPFMRAAQADAADKGSRPPSGEGEAETPLALQFSMPRLPSIRTRAGEAAQAGAPGDDSLGAPLLEKQADARPGAASAGLGSSVGTESSVIRRSALRAAALSDASPGLAALLGPVSGLAEEQRGPTARQLAQLGAASSLDGRLHLHLFPETPEGRVAQVRWYSFQFLLEELTEEISALQHALNDCLAKLPE